MRENKIAFIRKLLGHKAIIGLSRFLLIALSLSALFYAAIASISIIYYFGAY